MLAQNKGTIPWLPISNITVEKEYIYRGSLNILKAIGISKV